MKIVINCPDCNGTGVHVGSRERKGYGVVCWSCDGNGSQSLSYTPFIKRKKRKGIRRIRESFEGSRGTSISYAEFFEGFWPPSIIKEK